MVGKNSSALALVLLSLLAATGAPCLAESPSWSAYDAPWVKTAGEFGAMLVVAGTMEQFEAEIDRARPDQVMADFVVDLDHPSVGVGVSEPGKPSRQKVGVPVRVALLFRGCAPGDGGTCNLTARYSTIGPDEKDCGGDSCDIWVGKAPPPKGQVERGACGTGLLLGPEDSIGPYQVRAEVTDNVAKVTLRLVRTFWAVKGGRKD